MITGFDFNPTGEYVATIDEQCVFLISHVDKNDCSFHLQFPLKTIEYIDDYIYYTEVPGNFGF